jgi:pimeloyl-ACP methyl ester carboxylesterase
MQALLRVLLFPALILSAWADGPKDNLPDNVRPIPPPGILVPEKDAKELRASLAELQKQLDALPAALKSKPALLDLTPDIEIFHKAVRYALDYNEFFKTNEIAAARALLQEGLARVAALRNGSAPWTNATGLVVRGFRSRIDGSVQPYGVVIPGTLCPGCAPFRTDLWLHGRGETLSEVNFLTDRMKNPGQFTPPGAIVLHLYNRYCNPARFAGETDVFEALAHLQKSWPADPDRVVVRGFSMGGASTWHLTVHHAWRWAAAQPGAGFSETAEFLKVFQNEELRPQWWEQKLWRLYDATEHALNLFNVPTIAYSGEKDRQKQAADIMVKHAAKEGLQLTHLIGPDTEHKFEPTAKEEISRRIDALAARGRDPVPRQIKFTTFTLRYNRMFWLVLDGLEKHWERARVDADIVEDAGEFRLKTSGVTALTLHFEPGQYPLDLTRPARLIVDGQRLALPAAQTDRSLRASFVKDGRRWQAADSASRVPGAGLAKRHGLQGPIDDAFMDSFLFVTPTGTPLNDQVGAWVKAEQERAVREWRRHFRGDARVKTDREVTEADLAAHHLVLWGDPDSNLVLKRIAGQLPIAWDGSQVRVGRDKFDVAHHVPVMIHPNPLNPARYVVLNSSFTWREYDYLNNARQTPKLPDWAIVDLRTPPNSRWPGRIARAGFFGEKWELLPDDGR